MIVTLKSTSAIVQIDSKGAELISYIDVFGAEYMWQKDPKFWGRCSPLLFPIVSNLRNDKAFFEGKEYTIPKHGFCRDCEFTTVAQTENTAVFNYTYNEQTLKVYPYKFSLSLTYTLYESELTIEYRIVNVDDKPIDYCFGAHPAINIPFNGNGAFEDYCVEFEQNETADCPVFDMQNRQFDMNNTVRILDNQNRFMLSYDLFDIDAIVFDKLKSNSVKLYHVKTGRGIEVDFTGFDFVAFWTPAGKKAPFLCIEPWCGIAACSDEGDNFADKRAVKHLEISATHPYRLVFKPM
ncbi:MAG: aldose 1-epimerase family protein, partial [Oscillospiraceae bacterium]